MVKMIFLYTDLTPRSPRSSEFIGQTLVFDPDEVASNWLHS